MSRSRKITNQIAIVALILIAIIGIIDQPRAMFNLGVIVLSAITLLSFLYTLLAISIKVTGISRKAILSLCTIVLSTITLGVTCLTAYYFQFGNLPNPEVLTFIRNNISLIPAHILQTAPLLSIGSVILSVSLAAGILFQLKRILGNGVPARARSVALAGIGTMAVAIAMINFYPWASPKLPAPPRSPAVTTYLEQLPSRTTILSGSPEKKYPVIVILVESLRHDLLTKNPEDIPFLRELAKDNITFNRAYATASHSNLTDLAFWYSQYPLRGEGKETYPVDASWKGSSLFSAFKNSNYRTAYISSQNERWGGMINWLDTSHLDYFFHSENFTGTTWENYDDTPGLASMIKQGIATAGKVEDSQTLEVAKKWIRKQADDHSFFIGMNLQNTHYSYVIPEGGTEPHQPSTLGFRAIYYSWPQDKAQQVKNRYLNAVSNVDRLLAEFAHELKQQGLWDESLFVVLGDNGEGFYEHGFGNHSGPMYDEAVRTLAIIKPPKSLQIPQQEIDEPISHIDLAATTAHLAGLEIPGSFQGRPLINAPKLNRPVLMYSNAMVRQFGVVEWPWKYLKTEHPKPREELYNLSEDSAELNNRASSSPEVLQRMRATGDFWRESQTRYYAEGRYMTHYPPSFEDADLLNPSARASVE